MPKKIKKINLAYLMLNHKNYQFQAINVEIVYLKILKKNKKIKKYNNNKRN